MTYIESYLNCKDKEEFKKMVSKDILFAQIFNRDRLRAIEKAVDQACKVHPEWSDTE